MTDELAQARTTKKEFLAQMNRIMPCDEWIVSALIQGVGACIMSLMLPYVIAVIFKPEMHGMANGWYITSRKIAQLIIHNPVPRIKAAENFAPAWWVTVANGAVILFIGD